MACEDKKPFNEKYTPAEALERAQLLTGYWYDRVTASGREALLFGRPAREQCIRSVRRTLWKGEFFGLYPEFPLLGDAFLDLSVHDREYTGGFLEGDGFGYAPLFSYSRKAGINSIGLEFDLSRGGEAFPHAMMAVPVGRVNTEYIKNCLTLMGLGGRSEQVLRYIVDSPWELAHFGGFLNAADGPIRITFRLWEQDLMHIRTDMGLFLSELSRFGFKGGELPGLPILAQNSEMLCIGFDVMPDGKLSSSVGCECGMKKEGNNFLAKRFMQSENVKLFSALEDAGLIDSRWKEAVNTAFASLLTLPNGERIIAVHSVHTVKLRWKDGRFSSSKMYTDFSFSRYDG